MMMRFLIVIAIFVCASVPAAAEVAQLSIEGREIRADRRMPQIVHSKASCVCIGADSNRRYFLTSGHCFTDITPLKTQIQLKNGWHSADILSFSRDPDLACLAIPLDGESRSMPLAESLPGPGTEVTQVGFTLGGPYQVRRGPLQDVQAQNGFIAVQVTVDQGDSGGAILYQGQTVGILSGYPDGMRHTAIAVDAMTCRRWIQSRGICQPAPQQNSPTPPSYAAPQTQVSAQSDDQLRQQLTELMRRLNSGELRGPAGPVGPPGPAGEQGFTGAAADPDELQQLRKQVAQLQAQLNQIRQISTPVRTRRPDGTVFSEDVVHLFSGEAIEFTLKPRSP